MIKEIHSSKLHMAMSCPGSLFFKDLAEPETSEAAKEGTAAAEYLERLLSNQPIGSHARNGVPFTDEMAHHCKQVADNIRSKASGPISVEESVAWSSHPSGIHIHARYDVSFIGKDGRLYIDDLKYGFGLVEVKENWQLLSYAIGKVMKLGKAYDLVLRIQQPRAHHEDGPTREWIIDYKTLLQYKDKIDTQLDKISKGLNTLVTGPQCRYCPAAAVCPAHNKAYHRGIEVTQEFVQDTLDNEELSFQLDLVSRVEEVVKTRKGALEQLAKERIKEGELIPNYIAVDNYGHRKWKDVVTPEAVKLMTGLDLIEKSLMSPAKAERCGLTKEMVDELTTRPHIGTKLKRGDSSKVGNDIFGTKQPTKEI